MMLIIKVGRRPKRSAMRPKMKAPTGRMARVRKSPSATAEILVWKSVAMALRHHTMMKEIERVERPAEKAGDEGTALRPRETAELVERVLSCPDLMAIRCG